MIYLRAFLVWLIIIATETCHGILRNLYLATTHWGFSRPSDRCVYCHTADFYHFPDLYKIHKSIRQKTTIVYRYGLGGTDLNF